MVENGCKNGGEIHDLGALGKTDDKQFTPVCLHQLYLKFDAETTHTTDIQTSSPSSLACPSAQLISQVSCSRADSWQDDKRNVVPY